MSTINEVVNFLEDGKITITATTTNDDGSSSVTTSAPMSALAKLAQIEASKIAYLANIANMQAKMDAEQTIADQITEHQQGE